MFPLRDLNPTSTRPVVTWLLMLACILAFVYELLLPPEAQQAFLATWALVPARLSAHEPGAWLTVLTSMFLHGGILHIVGNLWFLRLFGDNVEDGVGRGRYLLLYLVSGVVAAGAQYLSAPWSDLPMVGASGAIGGVLGAYLVLYPRARVLAVVPIFFFIQLLEVPAVLFLGLWLLLQFVGGLSAGHAEGGVAYWAHVGGFVTGMVLGGLFRPGSHGVRQDRRLEPGSSWRPPERVH
jgi:membrane associated rhomboid family serine protease